MFTIEERNEYLLENTSVDKKHLHESLMIKPDYLEGFMDFGTYLSTQAVLGEVTMNSPKIILGFLDVLFNNVMFDDGFINEIYRLSHLYNKLSECDKLSFLEDTFGRYYISMGLALLDRIDDIERYSIVLNIK